MYLLNDFHDFSNSNIVIWNLIFELLYSSLKDEIHKLKIFVIIAHYCTIYYFPIVVIKIYNEKIIKNLGITVIHFNLFCKMHVINVRNINYSNISLHTYLNFLYNHNDKFFQCTYTVFDFIYERALSCIFYYLRYL